jgi:hypothetical protein
MFPLRSIEVKSSPGSVLTAQANLPHSKPAQNASSLELGVDALFERLRQGNGMLLSYVPVKFLQ